MSLKKKEDQTKKLKMRIDRLLLDNNQQTCEALKHVYTALISNVDIEISIDLPTEPPIDIDERSVDTNFAVGENSDGS
jgi:hypothetical protein